jgi:hypothetical protein
MSDPGKTDLFKEHKDEYRAQEKPGLVEVGRARYLAIEGEGAPGDPRFQNAIGALYAAAYTLKMTSKAAGRDYVVSKLEAQWWAGEDQDFQATSPDGWRWRAMIRTPGFIREEQLAAAADRIASRQPDTPIRDVSLVDLDEGRCVQVLHIGSYDSEPETIALMEEYAAASGVTMRGPHHEIYLSDPRRVEPERLRTILRCPVS